MSFVSEAMLQLFSPILLFSMAVGTVGKFYVTTLAATDWMIQGAAELRMFEHIQDSRRVDFQENVMQLFRDRNIRLDALVEHCFGPIKNDRLRGRLGLNKAVAEGKKSSTKV